MKEIYDYLKSVESVTDIFGSGDNCRIYPLTAPLSADTPYISYFIVSKGSSYQHDGRMGIERYIIQVSVYGNAYHGTGNVRDGADAVITAMDDLSGQEGLEAAFQEEELLIREEETGYFHIPLTFAVWK